MICIFGAQKIKIVEAGLKSRAKLDEGFLLKIEELQKIKNSLIFIEKDISLNKDKIDWGFSILVMTFKMQDNGTVRLILREGSPAFKKAEKINVDVIVTEEIRSQKAIVTA